MALACCGILVPGAAGATEIHLGLSAGGQRTGLGVAGIDADPPTPAAAALADKVRRTLVNDLLWARYFVVVDSGPPTAAAEYLPVWRALGVAAVTEGTLRVSGDTVRLIVRVRDAVSGDVLVEKTFSCESALVRRTAHEWADDIVRQFTGERGIASTRIAFVNNQTRSKELYVMDYDGHGIRRLTNDNSIIVLPRWSPDGRLIAYSGWVNGNPDLFGIDPDSGRRQVLSDVQGLNIAPAFLPDGKQIIATLSKGSYPNLYLLTQAGAMVRQLTNEKNIVTSPSVAPNGNEIVFVSDKSGYPQLYLMTIQGGNIRRIPANGMCDSPAWSPRGDRIAFTMRLGSPVYDLFYYDIVSGRVVRLTHNGRNNENPSWSPDGRCIVYATNESGRSELFIMDADGGNTRKAADLPGMSATPSWSP